MKKTCSKKLLSLALSFVLLLSIMASAAISASALEVASDLDDSFEAQIIVPALNKAFTRVDVDVRATDADGSDEQLWLFEKVDGSDAYTIESKVDGRYLAVQGDLSAALANVFLSDVAQEYNIYKVNGKYVISPVGYANKAVDVNGVDFNVQYWDLNEANACQQYEFVITGAEDDTTDDTTGDTTDDTTADDTTADDTTGDDTTADDTTADDTTGDDTTGDTTGDDTTGDDTTNEDLTETPDASTEVNYAAGKKYTTTTNDGAPAYLAGKADTEDYLLTDGVIPEAEIGGETVAFEGTSKANAVVINLGKKYTDIDKLVFGGVRIDGNRQFTQVIVEVSTNGKSFTKVDSSNITREDAEIATGTYNVTLKLSKKITAKYVKVTMISSTYVLAVSEIQVIGYGAEAGGDVDAGESENPGDAGYVVVALVAAISLAGAVIVSKRKFN